MANFTHVRSAKMGRCGSARNALENTKRFTNVTLQPKKKRPNNLPNQVSEEI
jgi:hypothetical protein